MTRYGPGYPVQPYAGSPYVPASAVPPAPPVNTFAPNVSPNDIYRLCRRFDYPAAAVFSVELVWDLPTSVYVNAIDLDVLHGTYPMNTITPGAVLDVAYYVPDLYDLKLLRDGQLLPTGQSQGSAPGPTTIADAEVCAWHVPNRFPYDKISVVAGAWAQHMSLNAAAGRAFTIRSGFEFNQVRLRLWDFITIGGFAFVPTPPMPYVRASAWKDPNLIGFSNFA